MDFVSVNRELIEKALSYSKEHLGDARISVEDIARHAGFSTNYFNRIFLFYTGFSVMEYIRFERLKRAAYALRATDEGILEIALEQGYTSHEGFIRSFRRQYGCSPSEYRENKKGTAVSWGELVDATLVKRFLSRHPAFRIVDEDEVIDCLLARDARRFGYLCTSIGAMGLRAVTDRDDPGEGFVLVGDKRDIQNNYYTILVTDNTEILKGWLADLEHIASIHTAAEDALPGSVRESREYMYLGEEIKSRLPENLEIHRLTPKDAPQIRLWAGGRKDGYAMHLLHLERCAEDEHVLEFGVFERGDSDAAEDAQAGRMIAAVGCGVEWIRGLALNDCIQIRFSPEYEIQDLYRPVFAYVTNEIVRMGIRPFDNIQYGDYAGEHGGFTSEELGYQLVNRIWFTGEGS